MTGEMNQQRFKALLKETITLLCSNGLNFKSEFTIEAVIGITIDRESILLLSIQDTIASNVKCADTVQQTASTPQFRPAHSVESEFTPSLGGMLKPHTDTVDRNDEHSEDIAFEIVPVLHRVEAFEPTSFNEFTDGLNIKLEQTEGSFELKSDERSSSSCGDVRAQPNFASDGILLSCAVQRSDRPHKACFSNGKRHLADNTNAVEKAENKFPRVASASLTIFETSTLNGDLNVNGALQSAEENPGDRTGVRHPNSEIEAVDHSLTSRVALARVRTARKSNGLPGSSQDMQPMQPATGRNRKKSALSPYQCKICGKRIGTLHSLAVHEATVHLGKYRYSCPNCGKGYTVLSNLRAHIACKHNKQKEFVCGFCGREYGYKHSLKEHILLAHNGNSTLN